jgi:iron complex outermembrane receptor protein
LKNPSSIWSRCRSHSTIRPTAANTAALAYVALTVSGLLAPCESRGQDAGSPISIAPVVVEQSESASSALAVSRERSSTQDSTGFVEVVELNEIWRSTDDLPEIIGRSTGVRVRAKGGRNHSSTLSVRGSSANRVKVLLDGIALGRASNPIVDLALLPGQAIDSIEIYRGFTPVGFAASGAASTINIKSKTNIEPGAGLALSYGSYDTARVTGQAAGKLADGLLTSVISLNHTQGDFRFHDDNGSVNNPDDDTTETRQNNEVDSADLSLAWSKPMSQGRRLIVREFFLSRDEELPGQGSFKSVESSIDTLQNLVAASLDDPANGWALGTAAFLQKQHRKDKLPNPDRPRPAKFTENRNWALSSTGRWSRLIADRHFVETSAQFDYEGFSGREGDNNNDQQRHALALAVGDEIEFPSLDLLVSLQLRHQRLWNNFEDGSSSGPGDDIDGDQVHSTDPRLGLRWTPLSWFDLRANAATTFRAPDFSELFGSDGLSVGNPELKPEQGESYDVGFGLHFAPERWEVDLEYTYFDNQLDDGIVVALTFNRVAKAKNAEKTRIRGHEISLDARGPAGLSFQANYVHQDPIEFTDGAPDRKISGVADDEFATRLAWERGRVLAAYELSFVGKHTTNSENTDRLHIASRLQHDLSLTLGPFQNWGVSFEVENISDTLVPDELGFPVPGRSFFTTVSYSWEPQRR